MARSRGLGDVYKRQTQTFSEGSATKYRPGCVADSSLWD
jgi:hypothetical protein